MTTPKRSDPAFLRRDMQGRAIYMPFGTRAVAYLVPEEQVEGFSRRLGYLTWGSVILLGVLSSGLHPSRAGLAMMLGILVALALVLWLWIPQGLERVTLLPSDLPPLDWSPQARAARVGKAALWLQLILSASLTVLCLFLLPARPVLLGALAFIFGLLTWDSVRCLRAAYSARAQ